MVPWCLVVNSLCKQCYWVHVTSWLLTIGCHFSLNPMRRESRKRTHEQPNSLNPKPCPRYRTQHWCPVLLLLPEKCWEVGYQPCHMVFLFWHMNIKRLNTFNYLKKKMVLWGKSYYICKQNVCRNTCTYACKFLRNEI